jgi:hypothetical protein
MQANNEERNGGEIGPEGAIIDLSHNPFNQSEISTQPPVPPTYTYIPLTSEDRDLHRAQRHLLFHHIREGRCKHLYWDMGTNYGVTLRKLYEPKYYPAAKWPGKFNSTFGPNWNASDVCAIGFEPNDRHTSRLVSLQKAYQNGGFPVVIFTRTAVASQTGERSFYIEPSPDPNNHEWGSSLLEPTVRKPSVVLKNLTVLATDINGLVHSVHAAWIKSSSYNVSSSKCLAKVDVEGAEFEIIPHMLAHGSLCLLDVVTIEWHRQEGQAKFLGEQLQETYNRFR